MISSGISNGTGNLIDNGALRSLLTNVTLEGTYLSNSKLSGTKPKTEENKGMNFDDILSIYKEETLDIIAKAEEKRTKEIREIDPVYIYSKERYEDFIKFLEDNKVYDVLTLELDCCISDMSDEEINKIAQQAMELRKTLYNILSKVNAMLKVCNTYEQGIEILKAYDILKPDLTLNILDSNELFEK